MKKSITLLCLAILTTSIARAEDTLTFLQGTWAGTGTTSGMASSVRHTWTPTLNGRFMALRLHNRMTLENGQEVTFEGNGYYQASEIAPLSGVWIDSNGDILPLKGTVDGQSLVVTWGSSETKLGQSNYRVLPDGTMETSDYIADDEGEWQKFAHAILHRSPVSD